MKSEMRKDELFFRNSRRFALLLAIWATVALTASLAWNVIQDKRWLMESARIEARVAFDKDVVYRRWNAGHGGVYVPVTEKTQPNPYLGFLPERDISTKDGKRLTLMNPAWMTREVRELGKEAYGVQSHITSLNPVRPENAADAWETEALEAFERGATEVSSLEQVDGKSYMRLMRPLVTEKRCLKCHARHGYKEGEIRGGISASVPMEPLWAIMRTHFFTFGLVHGLLWLMSMGAIYAGLVWLDRSERKREKAEEALKKVSVLERKRAEEAEKSYGALQESQSATMNLLEDLTEEIAERKRTEKALRQSEEKLRRVIEESNDGIYVLQAKRFVFINPRFTEITGYELEEISGEDFDFRQLVAEEGLKVLEERQAMRDRGKEPPSRYVFEGLRKDNRKRHLEVSVTKVEWDGGPAILGILRDVTDRIQARKELERALGRAQEGERVKSLFLANMSHEIRTPLNSILGFTDLIEESTAHLLGPEERTFFDTVRSSGKRLMNTVHEILDMSQIEAGTLTVDLQDLDIVAIVKEATAPLIPRAEKKGLRLSFSTDISDGVVKADEYCLIQALTNVVENALKYTDKGGIDIALAEKDSKLILSIKDTGIGISAEYLDKIFEVFTQESSGYTKEFQGVGLGLALTKRYLDLCNATISVESEKGVGSIFTLTFQKVKKISRKKVRKPKAKMPKVPVPQLDKKPLVLVVEDDESSQKLISFFLRRQYDVSFVVSVDEARRKLKSEPIEIILLDLSLIGEEDGLDLVRFLRKTSKWKNVPIIATTAHAFERDRENCLAAGCNDYLAKPIRQTDLLKKIKELLRQSIESPG